MTLPSGRLPEGSVPRPAQDLGEMVVIGDKINAFIEKNPTQLVSMGASEIEERNFLQVRGNPDLAKEKVLSLTLGLDHSVTDALKASASLFRTDS